MNGNVQSSYPAGTGSSGREYSSRVKHLLNLRDEKRGFSRDDDDKDKNMNAGVRQLLNLRNAKTGFSFRKDVINRRDNNELKERILKAIKSFFEQFCGNDNDGGDHNQAIGLIVRILTDIKRVTSPLERDDENLEFKSSPVDECVVFLSKKMSECAAATAATAEITQPGWVAQPVLLLALYELFDTPEKINHWLDNMSICSPTSFDVMDIYGRDGVMGLMEIHCKMSQIMQQQQAEEQAEKIVALKLKNALKHETELPLDSFIQILEILETFPCNSTDVFTKFEELLKKYSSGKMVTTASQRTIIGEQMDMRAFESEIEKKHRIEECLTLIGNMLHFLKQREETMNSKIKAEFLRTISPENQQLAMNIYNLAKWKRTKGGRVVLETQEMQETQEACSTLLQRFNSPMLTLSRLTHSEDIIVATFLLYDAFESCGAFVLSGPQGKEKFNEFFREIERTRNGTNLDDANDRNIPGIDIGAIVDKLKTDRSELKDQAVLINRLKEQVEINAMASEENIRKLLKHLVIPMLEIYFETVVPHRLCVTIRWNTSDFFSDEMARKLVQRGLNNTTRRYNLDLNRRTNQITLSLLRCSSETSRRYIKAEDAYIAAAAAAAATPADADAAAAAATTAAEQESMRARLESGILPTLFNEIRPSSEEYVCVLITLYNMLKANVNVQQAITNHRVNIDNLDIQLADIIPERVVGTLEYIRPQSENDTGCCTQSGGTKKTKRVRSKKTKRVRSKKTKSIRSKKTKRVRSKKTKIKLSNKKRKHSRK